MGLSWVSANWVLKNYELDLAWLAGFWKKYELGLAGLAGFEKGKKGWILAGFSRFLLIIEKSTQWVFKY